MAIPTAPSRRNGQEPLIEGVCAYGEATVECWNVEGERDRKLSGVVKSLLEERRDSVPTTFGRRNRIIVAVLPNPLGDLNYRVVTKAPFGSGETAISGVTGRQLVFVAEGMRAPTTTVRLVQSRRLLQTVSLAVKKGATAKLAGCTLTVESVEKLGSRDEMAFLFRGGPGWKVVVRRTGGGARPPTFLPIDLYPGMMADGRRMRFIGKSGKPDYAPDNVPRVSLYGDSRLAKDIVAMLIDRDPATSAPLRIGADQERTITLSDIPLEPK